MMVQFNYQSVPDFHNYNNDFIQSDKSKHKYVDKYNFNKNFNRCTKYGLLALMCPECYMIYRTIINQSVETKCDIMTKRKDIIDVDILPRVDFLALCKFCKTDVKLIEIDYNLAYSISILNRKGYRTKFCCEGHESEYVDENGYVLFEDNSILEYIDYLPDSWYVDLLDLKDGCCVIRYDLSDKSNAIKDLFSFARGIPNKE